MADETPAPLSDAGDLWPSVQYRYEAQYRHVDPVDGMMPFMLAESDLPWLMREVGRLRADNAALREIVAAVADGWSNALGTRIGTTPADGLALKAQARALLATQTPATGATAQAGEDTCDLCNGTGVYVGEIAWENPDGTIGAETKRTTCHGCNGTGKRKASIQTAGEDGEA